MATKEPSKNSLYFVCKRIYLKKELRDPHFLLLDRLKISAKFKNISGADS